MTAFNTPADRPFNRSDELFAPTVSVATPLPADRGSPLSRAIAAFLQPQNVKWLLIAGVLILLASSLMLVGAHWHSYAPTWKYLILLGYAAGVGVAGRWCYARLLLPRTGTVLMALTVLLLPITFLALNLVGRTGPPTASVAGFGLLSLNIAIAAVMARGIFKHFFHRDQPTFLACYLLLSIAGAFIATPASPLIAAAFALGLYATFAVGAIKVNRHCFWLVEEHRLPRICGFFPILLLGGQFLMLLALGPVRQLPIAWIGFGCALVAAVVLVTADSVAAVFRQRTGDLVRPIPWSIIGPIVAGLSLAAVGICLSAISDVVPYRPYALVPTAAVVAALMALVARRTGRQAFVWATLVLATTAYNFSPVFFVDVARMIVTQGAAAVSESRLPLAFYGLTYLPLLATLLAIGGYARRSGRELLAGPLCQFSFGLATVLLLGGLTHAKAMFPVAAAMTLVFIAHARVFADRRPAWMATLALLIAAVGLPSFARGVLHIELAAGAAELLSAAVAAGILLLASLRCDRRVAALQLLSTWARFFPWTAEPCRYASLIASVGVAAGWVVVMSLQAATPLHWAAAAAAAVLLMVHALVWMRAELALLAVGFVQVAGAWIVNCAGLSTSTAIVIASLAVLAQWVIALLLIRLAPASRFTTAFAATMRGVAVVELVSLLAGYYLPTTWVIALGGSEHLAAGAKPSMWLSLILVAWGCDAARRAASPALAAVCCTALLGVAGATAASIVGTHAYLLPALATAGLACVAVSFVVGRRYPDRPAVVTSTFARVALVPLAIATIAGLVNYTPPQQIAGVLAAVGLVLASLLRGITPALRWTAAAVLNLQAIALVLATSGGARMESLGDLNLGILIAASLPVATAAAFSLLLWTAVVRFAGTTVADIVSGHRTMLRCIAAGGLALSLALTSIGPVQVMLAAFVFAALIATELHAACRTRVEARVWTAITAVFAAGAYFVFLKVIPVGRGWSMFAPLIAAVVFQGVAMLTRRSTLTAVLDRPFRRTAAWLPLATVLAAIIRHVIAPESAWMGMGSLALLLAAGFYFHRGIERRQNGWHVLAAAIVNIAMALLWRELQLSDPQFYLVPLGASVLLMVQLLQREIPREHHNPLRYLGALMILVSPTFHIVGGSWLHLLSLMVLSVLVMFAGIGLRVRAMLYAGTAFLAADLIAMVVRGSIDQPSLLWLAGLFVGASVIEIAALAERHRENLLQRIRVISATLAQWQ